MRGVGEQCRELVHNDAGQRLFVELLRAQSAVERDAVDERVVGAEHEERLGFEHLRHDTPHSTPARLVVVAPLQADEMRIVVVQLLANVGDRRKVQIKEARVVALDLRTACVRVCVRVCVCAWVRVCARARARVPREHACVRERASRACTQRARLLDAALELALDVRRERAVVRDPRRVRPPAVTVAQQSPTAARARTTRDTPAPLHRR